MYCVSNYILCRKLRWHLPKTVFPSKFFSIFVSLPLLFANYWMQITSCFHSHNNLLVQLHHSLNTKCVLSSVTFGPKTRMIVTEVPIWVRRNPKKYFVSGPAWGKMIKLEKKKEKQFAISYLSKWELNDTSSKITWSKDENHINRTL